MTTDFPSLRKRVLALAPLAALLLAACGAASNMPLPPGASVIQDRALDEMSGLESSPTQADVLWSINDSGSLPRLYRLGPRGEKLGRVWVLGTWISDSETLAFWRDGSQDWLLIGDVGDNRGRRDSVSVHGVPEPQAGQRVVWIAWTLRFRYPDGPRDAEGIAVDHSSGDVLVMSKRDANPRLYRLPLSARDERGIVTAEPVGEVPSSYIDGEVTGLDLSKDGRTLAVLSYRGLYLWEREPGSRWSDVLASAPRVLDLPVMRKAEAMAFASDHTAIYVGSEKLPAPLSRISLE